MQPESGTVQGRIFPTYCFHSADSRFEPKRIGSVKTRPAPVASASPRARTLPAGSKKRRGGDYTIITQYAHVEIIRLVYEGSIYRTQSDT